MTCSRGILLIGMIMGITLIADWGDRTLFRVIYYNFSDIHDYAIFPNRKLEPSETPFRFLRNPDLPRVPRAVRFEDHPEIPLPDFLQERDTD